MEFSTSGFITKISVSDIKTSKDFYQKILGFKIDPKYTLINNPKEIPYIQMNLKAPDGSFIVFGLYNDIEKPFDPIPTNGTVPSFLVADIEATLLNFQKNQVYIDKIDGEYILTNTSDAGFIDKFFFFRDPDNNSLVIRENIN